jgi:hypothetical protein
MKNEKAPTRPPRREESIKNEECRMKNEKELIIKN